MEKREALGVKNTKMSTKLEFLHQAGEDLSKAEVRASRVQLKNRKENTFLKKLVVKRCRPFMAFLCADFSFDCFLFLVDLISRS